MSDADAPKVSERDQRVLRFNELCVRTGKLMGRAMDDQAAVIRAGLSFALEAMLNRMIETGELPNEMAAFVRLSELEIQHAPPPPLPVVKVEIVEGVQIPVSHGPIPPPTETRATDAPNGGKPYQGVERKPKPPEPSYMDEVRQFSAEHGFMPHVDLDRANGGKPDGGERYIGGFKPADLGQRGRERNPFSVIEPTPGSPGTVDNRLPVAVVKQ